MYIQIVQNVDKYTRVIDISALILTSNRTFQKKQLFLYFFFNK